MGLKDCQTGYSQATVVARTYAVTLQDFIYDNTVRGATIYTDEALAPLCAAVREQI